MDELKNITIGGQSLAVLFNQTNVEFLWKNKNAINWFNGQSIHDLSGELPKLNHSGAYIASVLRKLGIYILQPPQASQTLLENNQHDWLLEIGIIDYNYTYLGNNLNSRINAQKEANKGNIVIASYKNINEELPGNIAFVIPFLTDTTEITLNGCRVIQASFINYNSVFLKEAFSLFPNAFDNFLIDFFSYSIN